MERKDLSRAGDGDWVRGEQGGRGRGLVVGAEMRGWGLGARSRGSLWEGSGAGSRGVATSMGRVPGAGAGRGRGVVHGAECGPVADAGRGALRIPGGAAARSLAGAARPSK